MTSTVVFLICAYYSETRVIGLSQGKTATKYKVLNLSSPDLLRGGDLPSLSGDFLHPVLMLFHCLHISWYCGRCAYLVGLTPLG